MRQSKINYKLDSFINKRMNYDRTYGVCTIYISFSTPTKNQASTGLSEYSRGAGYNNTTSAHLV